MKLTGKTRVLGIFGDPVAHSLSPAMQNAAFQQGGIDAVYVPFRVTTQGLPAAVEGMRALGIQGVNVTIPHKEQVIDLLDEVDEAARQIGAVNVIVNRDGTLVGYNTDGIGFLQALREEFGFDPRGRKVLLLGAGGACRAAAVALAQSGAVRIGIANRTAGRARALAEEFGAAFQGTSFAGLSLVEGDLAAALPDIDLVVNTSAVGLKGESFAGFPWENLAPEALIYDMVYRQGDTPLIQDALARGHRAAGGQGMLAGQGEEAFSLWMGCRPPSGVMKSRLLAEITAC